jgi:hypothetical protein
MKKSLTLAVLGCASLLAASANANVITVSTAPGATNGGQPVDASATFITGSGTLSITLSDLLANPTDVAQLLSDLKFDVTIGNTSLATVNTGSSSGALINIDGSGNPTSAGTATPGWVIDSGSPAGMIHLDDLGAGAAGPKHLIIGPPGTGGVYSAANGSIAGNSAHNPFINGSATFVLNIPGMTVDSTIENVTFSFGTTTGQDVPGGGTVPDGGTTVLLLGASVSGLGLLRRKLS